MLLRWKKLAKYYATKIDLNGWIRKKKHVQTNKQTNACHRIRQGHHEWIVYIGGDFFFNIWPDDG